jgi:hypothetical protein
MALTANADLGPFVGTPLGLHCACDSQRGEHDRRNRQRFDAAVRLELVLMG